MWVGRRTRENKPISSNFRMKWGSRRLPGVEIVHLGPSYEVDFRLETQKTRLDCPVSRRKLAISSFVGVNYEIRDAR